MMDNKVSKKYIIILLALFVLAGFLVAVKYSGYFLISRVDKSSELAAIGSIEFVKIEDTVPDFTLDTSVYELNSMTVISNFEKGDDMWTGEGVFDEKIYYEGTRSLSLVSSDRKAVSTTLEKTIDLTNTEQIEFMLNVSDIEAFESASIDFGDSDLKSYYSYPLSGLKNGWNLIQAPKDKFILTKDKGSDFDWSAVTKVRFSLLSRPNSILLGRIDMLRSINIFADFLDHWRILNEKMFLSLGEQKGKTVFLARNIGASVATIKDVENINDFVFSASVSPQSFGRSGLFIRGNYSNTYGYYFLIGGNKKNTWQILKKNKLGWMPKTEMIEGTLDNAVYSNDNKYWLRVEAKGDLMKFYFSFDGQKYEEVGELRDGESRSGGVGIAVLDGALSLFDDFRFSKF